MECPRCSSVLLPRRVAPGVTMRGRASAWFVVSGSCPEPSCGAEIFGWSEEPDAEPDVLTTSPGFLGWRRSVREPVACAAHMFPALAISMLVALYLAFAVWAMHRMALVTTDPGSRLAYAVGPLLAVASQLGFVWLVVRDLAADWVQDRRVAASPPGGLRFVVEPTTYRD